jgi:hypothetical protein
VIDGAMPDAELSAAAAGLTQALQQLPPHTHVLAAVTDRAASFFDLALPRPQSWVLAGARPPPGADATRRALRASGVRPLPLADCAGALAAALRSLTKPGGGGGGGGGRRASNAHAGGGGGGGSDGGGADGGGADGGGDEDPEASAHDTWQRLAAAAAAVDLSLHLLGQGMAAWDARHKAELAATQARPPGGGDGGGAAAPPSPSRQPFPAKPMHAARVLFVTAGGSGRRGGAPPDARSEAELRRLYDALGSEAELRRLYDALGSKAAALDAQIDAITGDAAAPALPFLLDASEACGGALLHQPGLAAPFASNVAALVQRRIGWDAFIDVRTPAGVKVTRMVGPLLMAGPDGLPESISPVDPQPVAPQPDGGGGDGGGGGGAADAVAGGGAAQQEQQQAPSSPAQQQQQQQPRSRPVSPVKVRVARPAVPPTRLSPAAAAAPAIDRGRFYGAALELTADLAPGVAQEIQVLWEWTTADGRRVRQVQRRAPEACGGGPGGAWRNLAAPAALGRAPCHSAGV